MHETWNAFVDSLENTLNVIKSVAKDEEKSIWQLHLETCREIVAKSGLNWECGPAVLDRFETARRMAVKGERGWPKQQTSMRSIIIPHCYTSGGIAVAGLFRASRRMKLRAVPAEAYADSHRATTRKRLTRGVFGFDGGAIEFEAILHRAIPQTAIIKGCAWVGKYHLVKGWQWAITITIEEPPAGSNKARKAVAVDIGWRLLNDAIRVAVAVDEDGTVRDLRLPLDGARVHERRHNLPSGWRDLALLDSQMSVLLEQAKTELLSLGVPECCRVSVMQFGRMTQAGLCRLLCHLEQDGTAPKAVDTLQKWRAQNDRLRSIRAFLSDRLTGRRRWLYRNFAAQLCRSYRRVVLKRLPLKLVHQSPDALGTAARYRQWSSPGELTLYIRQAAVSHGAAIVEAEPAFSTTTCSQCGAQAIQTAAVVLTCANGHSWDQDENAARNLLSQLQPNSWQLQYVKERWPRRMG
jgi:hypothetical protein